MEPAEELEVGSLRDRRERAARRREGIPKLFDGLEVTLPRPELESGRVRACSAGAGQLALIEGSAQHVRGAGGASDRVGRAFHVLLQLDGTALVSHARRAIRLEPGGFVLVDGALPFTLAFDGRFTQALFAIPRDAVMRRHEAMALAAGSQGPDPAARRLVSGVLRAVAESAPSLDLAQRASAMETVVASLGALRPPSASPGVDRVARAMAEIEAELGSPELDARALAERQGISRRHLDALFATRGQTVNGWIWERRLVRAAEALESPANAGRTILDVAVSLGFSDASHFTRAFRRRFGVGPREWRRR